MAGGRGLGRSRGYGLGLGIGIGAGANLDPAPGIDVAAQAKWNLERQMEALEGELKMIRQRLGAMETQVDKKEGDTL